MKKFIIFALVILQAIALFSGCEEIKNNEEVIDLAAETEAVEYKEPVIGIWVPPCIQLCGTQEETDEQYRKISEAGVNMIYTFNETGSKKWMEYVLNSCEKYNISVIVCLGLPQSEDDIPGIVKTAVKWKDYPAVIGYSMGDEPGAGRFRTLGKEYAALREAVGEDKLIMVNLLPNYASDDALGAYSDEDMTSYQNYLRLYFERADTDIVSFDFYPYMASENGTASQFRSMYRNFCDIASIGKQQNRDTWGFVQCGSWNGTRAPELAELRFLTHYHLMFGLKGYAYFLYSPPSATATSEGVFHGMITYEGETTEIYDRVKTTCAELKGMRGVYLDYNFAGLLKETLKDEYAERLTAEYALDGFKNIKNVSSKNVIVSCFEKEDGWGLYLVNSDTVSSQSVTVTFDSALEIKVWGSEGIEQMGSKKSITVKLAEGEGKFVEIF